ncbi:DUF350 domain-containing protein [candidate division KSB1 bacterium]|nr:DUF350 domain-containing protein [candidate division KSB1 bacterium]RQW03135.1 MAG: DUF350 domain-containing protein [candidate division KSB1 bacterium]
MNEIFAALLDTSALQVFLHFDGPAYLITILIILVLAKLLYDLFSPFKLSQQLTEVDNKAVAVSFGGYMFAIGIVILGVFTSEPEAGFTTTRSELLLDMLSLVIWSAVGILLLNFARLINDNVLLSRFKNIKELIDDRNIGTGAVEFGSYVGSALIIKAALYGEDSSFLSGIIATVIYFLIGQLGFVIFAWIYQKMSRFDLYEEIEKDNISAGIAFGASLIAIAILLSGFIIRYDSLLGFFAWFVISLFFLIVSRYLVDKFLLPGALLDEEISRDQNWGAALIEGGIAIILALMLVPVFLG